MLSKQNKHKGLSLRGNKMKCKHKFKEVCRIKRKFLIFRLKDSIYSKCSKCGILRHDNDGDLFYA